MPPPQIAAYATFYQAGVTKIYICPAIAAIATPSRAELNAGLDVSRQVAEIEGWKVVSETMPRPDMSTRFTGKVGAAISADDSSLTFYASRPGVDYRPTLVRGYVGFVVFLDGGDVTGYRMDVFPVEITSTPKQRGQGELARTMVQFSISSEPAEDVLIPAT